MSQLNGRPELLARAVRKLVADLAYRTPQINPETGELSLRNAFAVLPRAQAAAVLDAVKRIHARPEPRESLEARRPSPRLSWRRGSGRRSWPRKSTEIVDASWRRPTE